MKVTLGVNARAARYAFTACALTFIVLAGAPTASAHPGNTDAAGGHYCRTNCPSWGLYYGQYHFHGGYSAPQTSPAPPTPSSSAPAKRWRLFSTPDGGVRCRYEPYRDRVGCSGTSAGRTAWVSRDFYGWTSRGVIARRGPVLWPGQSWSRAGFTCFSGTLSSGAYSIICYSPSHTRVDEDWFGAVSNFVKAYS